MVVPRLVEVAVVTVRVVGYKHTSGSRLNFVLAIVFFTVIIILRVNHHHYLLHSVCYSCVCGRPDDLCMVQCQGPAKEYFHLSCGSGLAQSFSGVNWCCLQCCIELRHRTRVVKYIPKGARIQVAIALSQLLEACKNQ